MLLMLASKKTGLKAIRRRGCWFAVPFDPNMRPEFRRSIGTALTRSRRVSFLLAR